VSSSLTHSTPGTDISVPIFHPYLTRHGYIRTATVPTLQTFSFGLHPHTVKFVKALHTSCITRKRTEHVFCVCRPIFTELLSVFFDDAKSETCFQRSAGCRDAYELCQ